MKIKDVLEWIQIADDDIYSAKILNNAVRKPYEVICYHCAQAAEKYLKGYLTYNDITPEKTHNLLTLLEFCLRLDSNFENIRTICSLLNKFSNDIRYPHKYEVNESDVNYSINAVEKIMALEPIKNIIDIITKISADTE